jgi:hypothetical protein
MTNKDAVEIMDQVVRELQAFVDAAKSWHDFHEHTEIQCDLLCERIAPARAALARVAGEEVSR